MNKTVAHLKEYVRQFHIGSSDSNDAPLLWRDNQDENSATIKMRMPRRLAAL